MARKNDGESAVSLFSFQDIITSITGIMFLVVLLLMLMMITSRMPSGQESLPNDEKVKALQRELSELKTKLQTLRSSQSDLDRQLEELKKLSPEAIQKQKVRQQHTLRSLQNKFTELKAAVQTQEKNLKNFQTKQQKQAEKIDRQQKNLKELQKELQTAADKLKAADAKKQQRSRMIKYVIRNKSGKRPIIAELNKDGIRFMDIDGQKIVDLRTPGRGKESLVKLSGELKKLNPHLVYFSIAVKPGGFKYAVQVLNLLKENNFERGSEILPNDEISIFEEQQP